MISNFFARLVGRERSSVKGNGLRKNTRLCRIEQLEEREMLSVNWADYLVIRDQYADLNLIEYATEEAYDAQTDYNIIEIEANNLTDIAIRDAIAVANGTLQSDLIVVRTTETQNTITLESGELYVKNWEYDYETKTSKNYGNTIIVSLCDDNSGSLLTIDGNKKSRVIEMEWGASLALGGLIITNGTHSGLGSAIYVECGSLMITKSTFSGNSTSGSAGAIYAEYTDIAITSSRFTENSANRNYTYADGGAINTEWCDMTITNTIFEGNSCDGRGGGVAMWGGTATLTNVVFVGNSSSGERVGGGMAQRGGVATLVNCTFAGNQAKKYGAGFYVDGYTNDDYNYGKAQTYFYNCISAKNYGQNYHTSRGGKTTAKNNIIGGNPFVRAPGAIGSKDYGDLKLADNSKAINKGNNCYVPITIKTDILGNERVVNIVDCGAYEYQGKEAALGAKIKVTKTASISVVTLTWAANAHYSDYGVVDAGTKVRLPETAKMIPLTNASGVIYGMRIEGLEPGKSYKLTVTAKDADGNQAQTASGKLVKSVKVTAKTQTYAAVKSLKAPKDEKGDMWIWLHWAPSPFPETNRYEVYCFDSKGNPFLDANITRYGVEASISELYPSTTYKFEVYAVSDSLGIKSKVAKITVKTDKPWVNEDDDWDRWDWW